MLTKLINTTEIFNAVNQRDTSIIDAFMEQIESGRLGLVDIHGHIFSAECAVPDLFKVRTAQKYFLRKFFDLLGNVNIFGLKKNPLQHVFDYAETTLHSMNEILAEWFRLYDYQTNYFHDKFQKTAVAPLAIDFETPYKLKPQISHRMQLLLTASLAKNPANMGRVLPFFGLDPRRADLNVVITEAFDHGFIGAKVYPSLGYLPSHPLLMNEVWPVFEQLGIPVIAHCSKIGIFSHDLKIPVKGLVPEKHGIGYKSIDREERFGPLNLPLIGVKSWQYFNDPAHWRPVLEQFPKLKVCISHLGGWGEIKKHIAGKKSWTTEIFSLMELFSNVYADISYVSAEKKFNRYFVKFLAEEKKLTKKIMLATDFPLNKLLKDSQKAVNEMLRIYAEYLPQIALENTIRFLRG